MDSDLSKTIPHAVMRRIASGLNRSVPDGLDSFCRKLVCPARPIPPPRSEITPYKAGIGTSKKDREGDGVELPPLGKTVANLGFEYKTQ